MKIYQFLSIALLTVILLFSTSCSTSSTEDIQDTTPGKLQLKFENGFNNLGNIVLQQTTQISSSGQRHEFSTLKYIISNIILIDDKGGEFAYHFNDPDNGAFIINQEEAKVGIVYINLDNIPKNNYKKVKFGLGISPKAYIIGQAGQGLFWQKAKEQGMAWAWAAGYIFTKLEGHYGQNNLDAVFVSHAGNMGDIIKNGTPDLYKEIILELPNTARVTKDIIPSIHILADLNTYLSGNKSIILNDENDNAMGSNQHLVDVTNNLSKMFKVDHVHND